MRPFKSLRASVLYQVIRRVENHAEDERSGSRELKITTIYTSSPTKSHAIFEYLIIIRNAWNLLGRSIFLRFLFIWGRRRRGGGGIR